MTPAQQAAYIRARQIPFQPGPSVPGSAKPGTEVPGRSEPAAVDVAFERGAPTGINGVAMPILDLLESLGTIAAAHGVGQPKDRDLREAPAAIVLHAAHRALRTAAAAPELDRLCDVVGREYADLVYRGLWFTPAREALDAFVNSANDRITGIVRLKLFAGGCEIVHVTEGPSAPKLVTITSNV
jgi:argininosuccinate synthase